MRILICGLVILVGCISVQAEEPMTQADRLVEIGRDRIRMLNRHLDPISTFVLPEVTRGRPPSTAEINYAKKYLKHQSPVWVGIHMPDDPSGRYDDFVWVNSMQEYGTTPVGTWMKDPQGNVAKKQGGLTPNEPGASEKTPIVLRSRADEENVAFGQWVVEANNKPWQFYGHVPWEIFATPTPVAATQTSTPRNNYWILGLAFLIVILWVNRLISLARSKAKREETQSERSWTPPPKQEPPPPKAEPPPRATPAPESRTESRHPIKVTSLAQAFDILGISVSSIEQARFAYKTRMLEYHPDRVYHLGKELRELALIKTTEFNGAMDYISSHLPKASL